MRAGIPAGAVSLAILAAAGGAPTRAEPPPVASEAAANPAVDQGRRLLDAVAQQDDATFLKTLHSLYPTTAMSDAQWLDARSHWRMFRYHGVERSAAGQADLSVLDTARDDWVKIVVTVDDSPAHLLTGFSIHAGRRPADVPAPPKLAPAALAAAADAYAADAAREDRFSGVVVISLKGRVLFQRAYGLADRAAGRPMTLQSKLRIGSMGKMFTTIAALQLAQAGKLDLTATVGRYLPGYPNRQVADTVTIDELLNHAGGLGDFFGPEFEAHRDTLINPKDYVARFGVQPPLFAAGTQQAYSNYGYVLLGRIIEVAAGEPYDRYVAEHIFRPARMSGSGYRPETEHVPGRAIGYASGPHGLEPATRFQVIKGTPGGGSYATGPDLVRFADTLMSGRLLGPKWLDRLTKTGVRLPNGVVGFDDFGNRHTGDGQLYLGHGGAAPGQDGVLHIFPDSGYTIVVLANRDPAIAELIAKFIEQRTP